MTTLDSIRRAVRSLQQGAEDEERAKDPVQKALEALQQAGEVNKDDRGLWYLMPGHNGSNLPAQIKSVLTKDANTRRLVIEQSPFTI